MLFSPCWMQHVAYNMLVLLCRFQHVDDNMLETTCWGQHVNPTCWFPHVNDNLLVRTCCLQHVRANMLETTRCGQHISPTCRFRHVDFNTLMAAIPTCWKQHDPATFWKKFILRSSQLQLMYMISILVPTCLFQYVAKMCQQAAVECLFYALKAIVLFLTFWSWVP